MNARPDIPDRYVKSLRLKRAPTPFSGLADSPELTQLFDASMILSDLAYDLGAYDAAHLFEQAMDAILVHKDRLDKKVYSFKTRRTLPKKWEAEKKGLEILHQSMIRKIAENAISAAPASSRKSNRRTLRGPNKKLA